MTTPQISYACLISGALLASGNFILAIIGLIGTFIFGYMSYKKEDEETWLANESMEDLTICKNECKSLRQQNDELRKLAYGNKKEV